MVAVVLVVLSVCESGGDTSNAYVCQTVAPPTISPDEAIAVASDYAAYIIQDGEVRHTGIEVASWRRNCIWLVTFDGLFYAPHPPPDPRREPIPEVPVCGRIQVKVWQDAGTTIGLTFGQTDDCD